MIAYPALSSEVNRPISVRKLRVNLKHTTFMLNHRFAYETACVGWVEQTNLAHLQCIFETVCVLPMFLA